MWWLARCFMLEWLYVTATPERCLFTLSGCIYVSFQLFYKSCFPTLKTADKWYIAQQTSQKDLSSLHLSVSHFSAFVFVCLHMCVMLWLSAVCASAIECVQEEHNCHSFAVKSGDTTTHSLKETQTKWKSCVSLTDHVIGDMNLDLPFCLKRHLAFNTLVGLFL